MDNKPDPIFSDGIYLNTVHPNAPEFIKANVSINVDKAIAWLGSLKEKGVVDEKGYIRLVGKESKNVDENGVPRRYFQIDTWKPNKEAEPEPADEDTVPF